MRELKTIQERENPLFNRKEVVIEIETNITPSKEEAEKLISEKFSVPVENIKIKKVLGKFGLSLFTIEAFIYSSKENKEKMEPKEKKEVKKPDKS